MINGCPFVSRAMCLVSDPIEERSLDDVLVLYSEVLRVEVDDLMLKSGSLSEIIASRHIKHETKSSTGDFSGRL